MPTIKPPSARDFDVIVVGDLNADLILSGDVTPAFGQVEKLLDNATINLGGSSAIFACGAARLGLRVALISKVGDDVFGRFVCHELEAHQVDISRVVVDPALSTGLTVILARRGDRALLTYPGAFAHLQYADIDLALLRRGRHLHIGSYFLLDMLRPDIPRLCNEGRNHNLTISLDANYDPGEQWQISNLWSHIDIFLPNETEVRALTGVVDIDEGLRTINQPGLIVAVKRGSSGGVAQDKTTVCQVSAIPVTTIDTTGAGDSFDAGFVYGYLTDMGLKQALQMAVICGSLSTQATGGIAAQPTLEEAMHYV